MMLLPMVVGAENVEINGIWYELASAGKWARVIKKPNYEYYKGSVNIPESVTYGGTEYRVEIIESSAFRGCSELTSITIPNSISDIGSYAFQGCSGLTSITIPNRVSRISNSAFSGCYFLYGNFINNPCAPKPTAAIFPPSENMAKPITQRNILMTSFVPT